MNAQDRKEQIEYMRSYLQNMPESLQDRLRCNMALLLSMQMEELAEHLSKAAENLDRIFEYLPFVGRGV